MRYRKKPVVIEAFRLGYDNPPDWFRYAPAVDWISDGLVVITTLEGDMGAQAGDYIIKGVQGELYPCKPDIFEETYEAVEE